jgi:hypothetical protein
MSVGANSIANIGLVHFESNYMKLVSFCVKLKMVTPQLSANPLGGILVNT